MIAVIGGSGFIGTVLIRRLLDAGHRICILDKDEPRLHADLWRKVDIRNLEALRMNLRVSGLPIPASGSSRIRSARRR